MKIHRIWLLSALVAILATTTGAIAPVAASTPAVAPKAAATLSGTADWIEYHHDRSRRGVDPNQPNFSQLSPAWTNSTLTGQIYASPLVFNGSVYIATEDNVIYALDPATGAVQWSKTLSTPFDSSNLPCGNVSPHVGITSTPVIDPSLNRIFAVGMVSTGHYVLWGVDLTTHNLVINKVVDPDNLDVTLAQGQRGALTISSGIVYIPYGGRAGDCDSPQGHPYHGILIGARRTDGAILYKWHTDSAEAGIWGPAGEAIDGSGNVYVSTGNGYGTGDVDSDTVIVFNPNLTKKYQFTPADRATLDSTDADLNSIAPGLVGNGNVLQSGKSGDSYLLSSTMTKRQGPTHVCTGLSNGASYGATAYSAPYIYIPCENALYAVTETATSFSAAWHFDGPTATSPIIAGGAVLLLDGGGNTLYALNPTTGAVIDSATTSALTHFAAPATGYGMVFVPARNAVNAFTMGGCTSADVSGSPASPQAPGASVTFTATSTGCTTPEYKFFLQPPGGSWTAQGGFGADTFVWDTTGLPTGVYGVGVWVRSTGSGASYESYWLGTYTLSVTSCTNADISTPTSPPQAAGATITFTASATRCPNPEFKFLKRDPFGSWAVARDWGPSNTWDWTTTNSSVGVDQLGVWVRQAGSTAQYEAYGITSFQILTSTVGGSCYGLTMTPSAAPPQAPGASVTFTAATNSCPQAQFKFWLLRPGGSWQVVQPYSSDNTWAWNTAGYANGTYQVTVYSKFINRAPGLMDWDEYFNMTFRLDVGQCTAGTISAAPASPQTAGTSITFTATATDCGAARFEFWRLPPPGATWSIVQAYGTGNTWTFNTTGARGPYRIGVWVRQNGSTAAYDSYAILTFWIGT